MLSIKDIKFAYGSVQVLHGVSLEVPKGKVVCLMGRNGVGKTTLIRNIVGLEKPYDGVITFDGVDVVKQPAHARIRSGMALVPQGRMIFPKLTVTENLHVGLAGRPGGGRTVPVEIFDLFPVLKEMGGRRGGDLSGGQQQQLAIGRALVGEPRLLLLDEPTEGIQPNIVRDISDVIRKLNPELGLTVLLVEQKLPFARRAAESFFIMERGRMVANGPMDELNDDLIQRYLTV